MLDKETFYSPAEVADMLSISKKTLLSWENSGKLLSTMNPRNQTRAYAKSDLQKLVPDFKMFNTNWVGEMQTNTN